MLEGKNTNNPQESEVTKLTPEPDSVRGDEDVLNYTVVMVV